MDHLPSAVLSGELARIMRSYLAPTAGGTNPTGLSLEALSERSGVNVRKLYGILHGDYERTRLGVADAILVALGRFDALYTGELRLVSFRREKPGCGHAGGRPRRGARRKREAKTETSAG